jgi:DNA-binding transcriptional regulator YhcF (GntR family)
VISVEAGSPVPPFEQLRAQLARQIVDHTLAAGTRLPTVRRLAADLGLANNTVARAYRELEVAGLVEPKGRAGTFVAATDEARVRVQQAAHDYASTATGLGIDLDEAIRIAHAALLTSFGHHPPLTST